MRGIDRFELVDKIARELQSRMTFEDIDQYLANMGLSTKARHPTYNSKWVYSKELLSGAPPQIIIQIANELGIAHGFTVAPAGLVTESRYWEPNHFRLFLSHLSSFKAKAGALRLSLRRFAISAFVAHEDIEPTREWQDEIEAALFSMDALAAIVTPKFVGSEWADQEVGVAIGRGTLVIPVMRQATPHGFIGKFQAVNGNGKSVAQVARGIFDTLLSSALTKSRLLTCLVDATVLDPTEGTAASRLKLLDSVVDLPKAILERLRDGAGRAPVFGRSPGLSKSLEELLQSRGVPLGAVRAPEPQSDEDIPF